MIRIRFYTDRQQLTGFHVSGHAGAGTAGEDIVCAAVSSAVYMTVNTITDVLHVPADVTVEDGLMELRLREQTEACQTVMHGLRLHLQALEEEYPKRVHLMNTEV